MLKLFFIIAGIILVGFLIMDESYNFSISTMGYEYSFSIVLLFVGIIALFYLIYFLKKPFAWFAAYKAKRFQQNVLKKENFLTLVLTTVLDKNNDTAKVILSKEKSLFAKGSTEQLLFDGLFAPDSTVFEKLKSNKATELAGIRGLFLQAKQKGDIDAQTQLLETGISLYPNVTWLYQEQLDLQLLQDDWTNALNTLEILNKKKAVDKARYVSYKACILYNMKQFKQAFELAPDNAMIAIAYAQFNPRKADDILKRSWELSPCWSTYQAYYDLIKDENAAKQMKLIEKFTSKNPSAKLSLLAVADTAMQNHLWGVAKESLQEALNSYTLTRQMALMMADLERQGWHHEDSAKEWEDKAGTAESTPVWMCKTCRHTAAEWDSKCPVCNSCGDIVYHV